MATSLHKTVLTSLVISFLGFSGYAQQPDSLRTKQIKYYGKLLNVDESVSAAVVQIQEKYRQNLKVVNQDKALPLQERRARYDALFATRTEELKALLPKDKLLKLIPNSEKVIGEKPANINDRKQ